MSNNSDSVYLHPVIDLTGCAISNDTQRFGIATLYDTSEVNQIHPQIEYQLPEFIQDEHREFVNFMREYYRFTEKKEGPLHYMRRLLTLQDVDQTTEEIMEFFHREYAPSFPRSTKLLPSLIIKNIKQFYLSKGSEDSFRFLFRVLFGQDIDFYYPRLDILRFSDGKWVQDRTIKCVKLDGSPSRLIGNRIIGRSSKASAFVENVLFVQDGSISTLELFLNRSSISGQFQPDEIITDEDQTCQLRVVPLVVKIAISNKGAGYKVGQQVSVLGEGFNSRAFISTVNDDGGIESIVVNQFGAGYKECTTTVEIPLYEGVTKRATGVAVFDTLTKYPGYFVNSDGMLSSTKRVQDGYYYQQFSYVIKSQESRDLYESAVKRLVHPAGLIFFSEVTSEALLEASCSIPPALDNSIATEVQLFTDLKLIPDEIISRLTEFVFQDASCKLGDDIQIDVYDEYLTYSPASVNLGPTWGDWDKWKADYRPHTLSRPEEEIGEFGFYDAYASTPLKAFANVKLSEITYHPASSIDFVPETDVRHETE